MGRGVSDSGVNDAGSVVMQQGSHRMRPPSLGVRIVREESSDKQRPLKKQVRASLKVLLRCGGARAIRACR